MTTQPPQHPTADGDTGTSPRTLGILMILSGVFMFTLLIGLAIFYFFVLPPEEDRAEDIVPVEETLVMVEIEGFQIPAYPNAYSPAVGGADLVVDGVSPQQVTDWYLTSLPATGYTVETTGEDDEVVIVATGPGGGWFAMTAIETDQEGQTAIFVSSDDQPPPVFGEGQPPAEEDQPPLVEPPPEGEPLPEEAVAESQPTATLPVETEPTPTLPPEGESQPTTTATLPVEIEPTPTLPVESLPAAAAKLALAAEVSPDSIFGGTWNILTYTLTVTGSGAVTVTATLPDGIIVYPDDLAALGLDYDQKARLLTWRPALGNGSRAAVRFEAANDLLAPPESLALKAVARSGQPGQQPVVQAATLHIEEY